MRCHDIPLLNQNYRRVPIEQSARLDVSAMAASSTSPQERARQSGGNLLRFLEARIVGRDAFSPLPSFCNCYDVAVPILIRVFMSKVEAQRRLALDGGVSSRRCAGRGQRSDGPRRDRLRCGEASGVVPDRAPPAAAGPQDLSLPAAGYGGDHYGQSLPEPAGGRSSVMSDTPQVLLPHHLKALGLPPFLREYDKQARQCAAEGVDHSRYLLRLAELEMIERERRTVERRIKEARFPAVKSLDSFDFTAIP